MLQAKKRGEAYRLWFLKREKIYTYICIYMRERERERERERYAYIDISPLSLGNINVASNLIQPPFDDVIFGRNVWPTKCLFLFLRDQLILYWVIKARSLKPKVACRGNLNSAGEIFKPYTLFSPPRIVIIKEQSWKNKKRCAKSVLLTNKRFYLYS